MTLLRGLGDFAQLISLTVLISSVSREQSCAGVSYKTQALRAVSSAARVADTVLVAPVRVLHILIVAESCYVLYLMGLPTTRGYEPESFPAAAALVICFVLACFINYEFSLVEVLFAFSVYTEAIKLIPQVYMLRGLRDNNVPISNLYMFFQASYHIFLTADWAARGVAEHHLDWIAAFTSCLQNMCYTALCVTYVQRGLHLERPTMPT